MRARCTGQTGHQRGHLDEDQGGHLCMLDLPGDSGGAMRQDPPSRPAVPTMTTPIHSRLALSGVVSFWTRTLLSPKARQRCMSTTVEGSFLDAVEQVDVDSDPMPPPRRKSCTKSSKPCLHPEGESADGKGRQGHRRRWRQQPLRSSACNKLGGWFHNEVGKEQSNSLMWTERSRSARMPRTPQ